MSSSGRYQSRLFNFLHRQSLRFTDQCGRAFRQVKVAAVWGVEILAYPVYLLVQATRLAGYQIQQAVQQAFPQLQASTGTEPKTAPTVDAPIQKVLGAVDAFSIIGEIDNNQLIIKQNQQFINDSLTTQATAIVPLTENSSVQIGSYPQTQVQEVTNIAKLENLALKAASETLISKRILIQGIASLLETRSLVLVSAQNQVVDILTSEQQKKINQKIIWELANYWRQCRVNIAAKKGFNPELQLPGQEEKTLLPVRWFWQFMVWVQQGQVATTTNIFREGDDEKIKNQPRLESVLIPNPSTFILDQLAFIDATFADLETRPVQSSGLSSAIARYTQSFLLKVNPSTISISKSSGNTDLANDAINQQQKINHLIKAAIDYFFGRNNLEIASSESQAELSSYFEETHRLDQFKIREREELPKNIAIPEADPWLIESDLFGEFQPTAKTQTVTTHRVPQLSGKSQLDISLPSQPDLSISHSIKKIFKQLPQKVHKKNNPLPKQPIASSQLVASKPEFEEKVNHNLTTLKSTRQNNIKHTPEWIETSATPVGYVKHPLEQLLEWLDLLMVWVEKLIMKIWRWIAKSL